MKTGGAPGYGRPVRDAWLGMTARILRWQADACAGIAGDVAAQIAARYRLVGLFGAGRRMQIALVFLLAVRPPGVVVRVHRQGKRQ
ncbi:hypothetical protein WK10_11145 [Burkholderia ubonensis]|nr:hypothetical protein WI74_22320 [Burkholderia ubonensis]KVR00419.1 hypothetical protein WK10_11145 [Burkholderia ubonensis]KVT65553.1 hypothetical protein WK55_30785 [Burkholderia ubonensis]KWC39841.1 hypothetical protein WL49_16425 [Burkholderia ubonensis]KWC41378.1 hypothetical protein WL48_08775 [Burkholderia ubonensis]